MKEMAINYFKFMRQIFCEEHLKICPKDSIAYQATLKEKEFYDMAIQALEQKPCDKCAYSTSEGCQYDDITETIPPFKTSDDAIKRQAVLEQIGGWIASGEYEFTNATDYLCNRINSLPPVTPQPKTGWIPVSEKLPKKFSYVNCTCHSLIDDREDWVVETCYIPQPLNSPYSDWGNIPMLNHGECEVIAWMYRDIPKPYKAENEG